MGRAITMENRQDELDRRLTLVEDALEELSHELVNTTKVHHVDLTDERTVKAEGVEVKPDEVFTAPVGKRKIKKEEKGAVTAT
jgi:hypothetical protein